MADSIARADGRALEIARHPVYSALLPIPIICFIGALITDLAYAAAPDMLWLDFSTWLLLAGLIGGGFAGLVLVLDLLRGGRERRRGLGAHFGFLLAAWIVEIFNSFVHARDGWTAVVPTGLALSIVAVVLALVGGWLWQSFARHQAGGPR
jgi:uncharacterized membrane protein